MVNPPDKPYTLQISNRDFPNLRYPINVASLDLKGFPGLATRNLFDPLQRTTYSIQWSLDYQRELTRDLVATVGYVGNHGVKALTLHWLNEVNFATGSRPNPSTGRVSYQEHSGMSNYDALQLSLKKRFAQTYMFNLHYTFGKALELGCSDVEAVRYLLLSDSLNRKIPELIDASAFAQYDRPMPALTNYDALLSGMEAVA